MEQMNIPNVKDFIQEKFNKDNSDDFNTFKQVAKVSEEAGEALGAIIKEREGRTTKDSVEEELADVILAAICALQYRKANITQLLNARWENIVKR